MEENNGSKPCPSRPKDKCIPQNIERILKSFDKDTFLPKTEDLTPNGSTVWKSFSKLFYKTRSKQRNIGSLSNGKEKEFSLHRLSSLFRNKKLSQNTLTPLTNVGESPTGYQAAFTEKENLLDNSKVTVMTIKLPDGITTKDVIVTVELSMVKSDVLNSESTLVQEPMTMYCTKENESQTVFTGILKTPNENEMINLIKMPLYLIDSLENVVLNPGSEITHKTIVKASQAVSCGNPFSETELDDVRIKLTFNKMLNGQNITSQDSDTVRKFYPFSNSLNFERDREGSVERVIMVNSYNASEISSILKGKVFNSDQTFSRKSGTTFAGDDHNILEIVLPENASEDSASLLKLEIENILKPKSRSELKQKTEDVLKNSTELNETQKLSLHKIEVPKKSSADKGKVSTSVPRMSHSLESFKSLDSETKNDVGIQYSNSYFTATKETNVQHSFGATKLLVTDSSSTTPSVEINDFTYFGDQKLNNFLTPNKSPSTDTPWPSSSATSVPATSVTLLSFPSECFYNTTSNSQKFSLPGIDLENIIYLKNTGNVENTDSLKSVENFESLNTNKGDSTIENLDSVENTDIEDNLVEEDNYENGSYDLVNVNNEIPLKIIDEVLTVNNVNDGNIENGSILTNIEEVLMKNINPNESILTELVGAPTPESLLISLHSNTDVDKEGKTEVFCSNNPRNKENGNQISELFKRARYTLSCLNDEDKKKGESIKSYKPKLEEVRKVDVHLSKNPFYFPEKEFIRKEDPNKRYFEDNDEFYEKHREDIKDFFQNHDLSFDHFSIPKSKKNYDLYLGGDQIDQSITNLSAQFIKIQDSERMIAVHDHLEAEIDKESEMTFSKTPNVEITANFVYDNIFFVDNPIPNKKRTNKHSQDQSPNEFDKNSSSIIFKVADGTELITTESGASFLSKKTILLEDCHSTSTTNYEDRLTEVTQTIHSENTLCKDLKENKNKLLSVSVNLSNTSSSLSVAKNKKNIVVLDKKDQAKKRENCGSIAYTLISERYFDNKKTNSKVNHKSTTTKILCDKHVANKLKRKSSLCENKTSDNTKKYSIKLNEESKVQYNNNDIKDSRLNSNTTVQSCKKDKNFQNTHYQIFNLAVTDQKESCFAQNQINILQSVPSSSYKLVAKCKIANSQVNKYSINPIKNINNEKHLVPFDSKINDLKDCLIKMNEIVITATSLSLLNNISSFDKTEHNNKENLTVACRTPEINLDLLNERQKTYETVENDIKRVIEELLKESKDIKESVILKGAIEESEPPFVVNYVKQEPIDYTKLCMVMMDKIEQYKQKNNTNESNSQKETKQEVMCVIDYPTSNIISINSEIISTSPRNSYTTLSNLDINEQRSHNYSNSFEKKQNTINTQMSQFCNSKNVVSKIPKTSFTFGRIVDIVNTYDCSNKKLQEYKKMANTNSDSTCNFNSTLLSTDFKSEHSFAEDHNPQLKISCCEPVNSTVVLRSLASSNDNYENFLNITNDKKSTDSEETKESQTNLDENIEQNEATNSSSKGVLKSKKYFQLTKSSDFPNTNDNVPSTSTQRVTHNSTDEEIFLQDTDLTIKTGFSTEEEEEVLLPPKNQPSSSRTFLKNNLFSSSSSDEDIYKSEVRKTKNSGTSKHSLASTTSLRSPQDLNTKPKVSLLPKPADYNLQLKFQMESAGSSDSILDLKILNAKQNSDISDADDESDSVKIDINLPKHRYKSKLELNSPQEVADIEKNLKDNEVLIKKNETSFDSVSFGKRRSLKRIKTETLATSETKVNPLIHKNKDKSKATKIFS